jgi:hypothetical protein
MASKSTILLNGNVASLRGGTVIAAGQVTTDGSERSFVLDNLFVTSMVSVIGTTCVTTDGTSMAVAKAIVGTGTRGGKKVTFTIPASSTLNYIIIANQFDTVSATAISADTTVDAEL